MAHLIDKAALVAEINQRVEDYKSHKINDSYHDGLIFALEDLRDDFINTLEVKEVDLEKEINNFGLHYDGIVLDRKELIEFAKHFFKLGLQASNTLTWKDIEIIGNLRLDVALDYRKKELYSKSEISIEDYCKEVLKRFNAQKGEYDV